MENKDKMSPLSSLEDWDDDVLKRYLNLASPPKQRKNSGIMRAPR